MLFVATEFGSWLIGQIADIALKRVVAWALGGDQERALRQAASAAVQQTVETLCPGAEERAAQMAMVINHVFSEPLEPSGTRKTTISEALEAAIARQLAPLGDASLTRAGESSAEVMDVSVSVLAEELTKNLLWEIMNRGSGGGPLAPLANQLGHDITHLQAVRAAGKLDWLIAKVEASTQIDLQKAVVAGTDSAAADTLPADVASFTGRDREFEQVRLTVPAKTDTGGILRIDVVEGMAGIGKTTFAVHAARQLAASFPDMRLFVPLHAHTPGREPVDPSAALEGLLLDIGVSPQQIPAGSEERVRMWRRQTAGRRIILLLDDAADTAQVRPLLPGAAVALVLITSRHRLTALAEAKPITLGVPDANEASRLFVRLADRPGLLPGDDAVKKVVARCGYLPLAISLTAGRFKHHSTWTVKYLASQLESAANRLSLMAAENLTVTVAFDLSYRGLSPGCRRLFRYLGLHPGADTDIYAAAALNGTNLAATSILVDDLYSYHLLEEPKPGRYRMHDLIREHARSLASAEPDAEREAALSRLLGYYLHTAKTADRFLARRYPSGLPDIECTVPAHSPKLSTREHSAAWVGTELSNLKAVTGIAEKYGNDSYIVAMSAALHSFLHAQGPWDYAVSLHRAACEAARVADDQLAQAMALADLGAVQTLMGEGRAAAEALTKARGIYRNSGDRLGEANTRAELGALEYVSGQYHLAIQNLVKAAASYRELGDRRGEARAISLLGIVQAMEEDYQSALSYQRQALALTRELGDQQGEARALTYLGAAQRMVEDYSSAIASLTEAVISFRVMGDRHGEALALNHLGDVQSITGEYLAAAGSQQRALDLQRELGDQLGEANALGSLGTIQVNLGNYPVAAASQEKALTLYRELCSLHGEAIALNNLGAVQLLIGNYATAVARQEEALAIWRNTGYRLGEATALNDLGAALTAAGNYQVASESLNKAFALFKSLDDSLGETETLNNKGRLLHASSSLPEARACFKLALATAISAHSPIEKARAMEGIGRCDLRVGNVVRAARWLRIASAIYSRLGSPGGQEIDEALRQYDR